jgi:hypothetical protein
MVSGTDTATAELGTAVRRQVFYDYGHLSMFVEMLRAYAPHLYSKRCVEQLGGLALVRRLSARAGLLRTRRCAWTRCWT